MDQELSELCQWIVAFMSSHEKAYSMCPDQVYEQLHLHGYLGPAGVTEKGVNILENAGVLTEMLS